MEIKVNKKEAFSLAEAMVVLVIIAIVMAMAAPLIAHKANTDQKRLIFNGVGAHIATAMGNSQNFGIGDNNPNDAKLTVKATNNSSQSLIAKFISNITPDNDTNAAKPIFQVMPKNSGAKLVNAKGFQVFADGTTNAACVPDYTNIQQIYKRPNGAGMNDYDLTNPNIDDSYGKTITCTPNNYDTILNVTNKNTRGIGYKPKQNGYLLSSRTLTIARATKYTNDDAIEKLFSDRGRYIPHNPAIITQIANLNQTADKTIKADTIEYKYLYNGFVMVPVGKDNFGCFFYPMSSNVENKSYYEDTYGYFAFVPCVK